ncbi:MAG TPA: chemotaxis protein CheW [Pyrinomonadaceae bacterium]|nr:chemotaxis protein CheW [Pyrinomonadaceae bacterium]
MNIDAPQSESFILFELAGTAYGVKSTQVQQLEMVDNITRVPNADKNVEGVVFSRGQVIPAINLRTRFGFEKIPFDLRSRLVVVKVRERTIGLIVDSAREFKNIPEESIGPPPDGLATTNGHYLSGIATVEGNAILLLDLEELISPSVPQASGEQG